ncbi:MAG: S49 family peptidase, partial [Spirochaetota bacterium]|nr:S49 family peptidase [Spirochaetota bacterium]
SDMAASGGYYIAMACPTIVANPLTITGSIGVVGGKFNMKGLYDKLGLKKEIFKRGKHADLFTDYRDFSPSESLLIAKQMKETYKVFVSKAAKSRKMSYANMNKLAQGKVYTGTQAVKVGLVDHLGGIEVAIALTKKKLGNNNLEIVTYPEARSFMELLGSNIQLKAEYKSELMSEVDRMGGVMKPLLAYLKYARLIYSRERVATLAPFYFEVK